MFTLLTSLLRVTMKVIAIPHVTPSSSPAMKTPTAIPPIRLLTAPGGDKMKIKECLPLGRPDSCLSLGEDKR